MTSLTSVAQEVLRDAGIEALPSLVGTERYAKVMLLDPSDMTRARKALRTAKLVGRRVSSTALDIIPAYVKAEKEDDDSVDKLISNWREFAQSKSRYRKAAKSIMTAAKRGLTAQDKLEAATQLSDHAAAIARKDGLPFLLKMAFRLKKAVKEKDVKQVDRIMADFASPGRLPKPIYRDPKKNPIQQKQASRNVLANRLFNKAVRFIAACAMDHAVEPEKIPDTYNLDSREYQIFLNLPEIDLMIGVDEPELAEKIWHLAQDAAKRELETENDKTKGENTGSDSGMGDKIYLFGDDDDADDSKEEKNCGFAVTSSMDVSERHRRLANSKKYAEEVLEFFAGECHPDDIDMKEVKEWASSTNTECDEKEVYENVKRLTGRIPNRHEPSLKKIRVLANRLKIVAAFQSLKPTVGRLKNGTPVVALALKDKNLSVAAIQKMLPAWKVSATEFRKLPVILIQEQQEQRKDRAG